VEILAGECSLYSNYLVQFSFLLGVGTAFSHLFSTPLVICLFTQKGVCFDENKQVCLNSCTNESLNKSACVNSNILVRSGKPKNFNTDLEMTPLATKIFENLDIRS